MYWQLDVVDGRTDRAERTDPTDRHDGGRFVLHRHRDADGPHLDLRLEHAGYLMGWRIDADALADTVWAAEKAPHPTAWLAQDGDALRVEQGAYRWIERNERGGLLALEGQHGTTHLRATRMNGVAPSTLAAIRDALTDCGADVSAIPNLIRDGDAARRRALGRLCGLGRELDGRNFDEAAWRARLAGASLAEVHALLESYEVRFDAKYPPQPVAQPATLDEDTTDQRDALRIALGN